MKQTEIVRLTHYKNFEEKGQSFFTQLFSYYANEPLLNLDDAYERTETTMKLKYLRKQYILELTYNEEYRLGQICVYHMKVETQFWTLPEFIKKESCIILYDHAGNMFTGENRTTSAYPDNCAEEIISEITK